MTIKELIRAHIITVLMDTNYNVTKAAKILGIPRTSLYRHMERFEINRQNKPSVGQPIPSSSVLPHSNF
jgi:DNA-binding NtrC family response regulator